MTYLLPHRWTWFILTSCHDHTPQDCQHSPFSSHPLTLSVVSCQKNPHPNPSRKFLTQAQRCRCKLPLTARLPGPRFECVRVPDWQRLKGGSSRLELFLSITLFYILSLSLCCLSYYSNNERRVKLLSG